MWWNTFQPTFSSASCFELIDCRRFVRTGCANPDAAEKEGGLQLQHINNNSIQIKMLSFSASRLPAFGPKPSKAPIQTFETPRFEGDSGIYSYEHYKGCQLMTINGISYIRDCFGKLRVRQ